MLTFMVNFRHRAISQYLGLSVSLLLLAGSAKATGTKFLAAANAAQKIPDWEST
jgi:hypothetical protein